MGKIRPPKIDNKRPNGDIKTDLAALKLGVAPRYYTYDPVQYGEISSVTEKKPNEYWIVRDRQVCPNCKAVHEIDDASKFNLLHQKRTVTLQHCYRQPSQNGKMADMVSATLHVLTFQRTCPCCKKLYRDSLNDLRDGRESITKDLKQFVKDISVQSDFQYISREFGVPPRVVHDLYVEEVKERDKNKRTIPQPECLGLYTLEFKDYSAKALKTQYCLCVDEQKQTFIGFFPWESPSKRRDFFNSIPNTSKVTHVFINLDPVAVAECRNIFPHAKFVVERQDVLNRSRLAGEEVFKEALELYPDFRYELPHLKKYLLNPTQEIFREYRNAIWDWYEKCPTLDLQNDLHGSLEEMYDSEVPNDAANEIDWWIQEDKSTVPPEKELEPLITQFRTNILDFISLRGTTGKTTQDRKEYEQLLNAAITPMERINDEGLADSCPARNASWLYLYGHIMYGVMDRVNGDRKRKKAEEAARNAVVVYKAVACEAYVTGLQDTMPEYVSYDCFSIPLKEMWTGLMLMTEDRNPPEPLMPLYLYYDLNKLDKIQNERKSNADELL